MDQHCRRGHPLIRRSHGDLFIAPAKAQAAACAGFSLRRTAAVAYARQSRGREVSSGLSRCTPLRQLYDIVSRKSIDEVILSQFLKLFSEGFCWSSATEQEVRDCRNALVDLVVADNTLVTAVVHELVLRFRCVSEDGAKIDLCGRVFDSLVDLKKCLRQILIDSPSDVCLEGDDLSLLLSVLRNHPQCRNAMDAVDGVFPSVHLNPKYHGLRCFFYRRKDGQCVDFSYARCADYVKPRAARYHENLCQVIIELCRLFPSVVGAVADSLELVYPHYNLGIEQHISVSRCLLIIARNVHPLRGVVYRLLFKKMTIIDAEIKVSDPTSFCEGKMGSVRSDSLKEMAEKLRSGELDVGDAKNQIDCREWLRQMQDFRTDEDFDEMTQKLDSLMTVVFDELHDVLMSNLNTVASENGTTHLHSSDADSNYVEDQAHSSSSDSESDSDEEATQPEPTAYMGAVGRIKQEFDDGGHQARRPRSALVDGGDNTAVKSEHNGNNVTMVSDIIMSELFDIFEDIILPTHNCKYVQFVYMYVISFCTQWTHLFLQRLLLILYDEEAHSVRRKVAASYIASIVCRANFIDGQLVCSIVYYLFSMLAKFDYLLAQCSDSFVSSIGSDTTPRSRNRFGESMTSRSTAQLKRFYSLQQDLLHIVGYHGGTIGMSPRCVRYLQEGKNSLCAFLDSRLHPIGHVQEKIIDDAIAATSIVPNLRKLHISLVRAKEALFSNDSSCLKGFSLKSVEKRYPFGSFTLYHSGSFIREKYRMSTYFESQRDAVTGSIKAEPDELMVKHEASTNRIDEPATLQLNVISAAPITATAAVKAYESVSTSSSNVKRESECATSNASYGCEQARDEPVKSDVVMHSYPSSPDANSVPLRIVANTNASSSIKDGGVSFVDSYERKPEQSLTESVASVADAIKDRLKKKHPRPWQSLPAEVEPDYDFWGFNYATQSSCASDGDEDTSMTGGYKKLKSETAFQFGEHNSSAAPTTTNRHESSDNNDLIVIGIDQLDDFELSLSSSILVNAPRRGSTRIFDMLTSTAAYKSAIINSATTKNSHKQSRVT
ncbi:RNA polymerase I specific transcription initiation factor RRN3, putative [Babesia ovata]|uniref:RNA polymerase I specific transcription initiation factor RRN3, putative n=1 Tax=Babesia ovata TaxID=189622 RepID=A0A2H6KF20_9APIC|nr:RNA polymerase I specific transcription initiation factor RRN3, putative [Babesia ovata]GBE61598.1 RNA polymerase I specific transcription initiation factor RRN3, putative [Babesia ovata]